MAFGWEGGNLGKLGMNEGKLKGPQKFSSGGAIVLQCVAEVTPPN